MQQGASSFLRNGFSAARLFFLAVVVTGLAAAPARGGAAGLEQGFQSVPDADKPWVYWWWLKANVSEASITSDLEAMKRAGIGGYLMFDARGYHEDHVVPPPSRMEFMSPEWRRMLAFAIRESARLGLEVSVNLSSCAGALKGPWEVGDDAPKKLTWMGTALPGGQRFASRLEKPAGKRFWEVALLAVRHEAPGSDSGPSWSDVVPKAVWKTAALEVVDLAGRVDAQGQFAWDVPPGHWTLLRFGCETMAGHEYDVDVLDPKAVAGHFERMGRALLQDAGPLAGKTLTHFYSVSWEGAAPTWTPGLDREFAKYRGYEIGRWLPALAGFAVQGEEPSRRFLADYFKTLGDCFRDNFYGKLNELCRQAGMKWHAESGGPWDRKLEAFAEADQLAFLARTDMPQGEFWYPKRSMNRPAAMTAHIYGKRLAATEAFTHMVQHWSVYPAVLKPRADSAFCDGINQFIWHTFTASPPELGQPGSEYFAGTHLNPNVTWFEQAGPFLTYLGRCQFLLRQGLPVNDVCTYIGDRPYLHWDKGAQWREKAGLSLGNGYGYDLLTTEVLLNRLAVKNGELVLPEGVRYRVLVVDLEEPAVPPAVLRRIAELKQAGATVVPGKQRPERAVGLSGSPGADEEVRRLAAELWNGSAAPASASPVNEALGGKGVLPDFEGPWSFTHRQAADLDIYFVAGTGTAECIFRVEGQARQAELWDPVSGRIEVASGVRTTSDGRSVVPLTLPENGAVFVVFRKAQKPEGNGFPATPTSPRQFQTVFWRPEQTPLRGPWTVQFQPNRGAPASAVFDQLTAWDKHADPGIRHFSGTATYRQAFDLTEDQARNLVRLQLGEVKCLAGVKVNGKDLGVVWTAPWSVELTGAVKPGRNELEIAVTNTWMNRLIGDAALPPEQRIAKTNVGLQKGPRTFKAYQGFASTDPLLPSGLLGPVQLEFGAARF